MQGVPFKTGFWGRPGARGAARRAGWLWAVCAALLVLSLCRVPAAAAGEPAAPGEAALPGEVTAPDAAVPGEAALSGEATAPDAAVPGEAALSGEATAPDAAVPGEAALSAGAAAAGAPVLGAKSAILVEQATMQPLFEQNADERLAPASITKVMTLLLVMEAIDRGEISLEDMVVASEHASSMGGSQIWLEPNEQMSVDNLLKATAVASANDAAVALAEKVAGTEGAFVDLMNKKAQALGLQNTSFKNCTGLDEDGHFTSARDIAVMAGELLRHPAITNYTTIWMDELRGGETQLVNTNKLVYHYQGTTGLKTGSTDNAGRCLCATATRSGMSLISVVLGAPTSEVQFGDSTALLDWGFGTFMSVQLEVPADQLAPLAVQRGVRRQVALSCEKPEAVVIPRSDEGKIEYHVSLAESVTAPVEAGQTVGQVRVLVGEKELCAFPVKAQEDVLRMTFWRAAGRLFKGLVCMGPTGEPPAPPKAPVPPAEEGAPSMPTPSPGAGAPAPAGDGDNESPSAAAGSGEAGAAPAPPAPGPSPEGAPTGPIPGAPADPGTAGENPVDIGAGVL